MVAVLLDRDNGASDGTQPGGEHHEVLEMRLPTRTAMRNEGAKICFGPQHCHSLVYCRFRIGVSVNAAAKTNSAPPRLDATPPVTVWRLASACHVLKNFMVRPPQYLSLHPAYSYIPK